MDEGLVAYDFDLALIQDDSILGMSIYSRGAGPFFLCLSQQCL